MGALLAPLLRECARTRGGHNMGCLITLVDAISASQKLRIAPSLLEAGARHRLIPHYRIGDEIRFDPVELDRWVKRHKIDEVRAGGEA